MSSILEPGDAAPPFTIETADGPASLSDYAGKTLVLYFYPKDDTPGCTTEANDFSALAGQFEEAGAAILGVSRDTVEKHRKFAEKHQLSIRLGADVDGVVCEAFGVWVEKKNYGKTYMGIERSTFLIDPAGKIAQAWRKVRVKDHAQKVLEAVRALG